MIRFYEKGSGVYVSAAITHQYSNGDFRTHVARIIRALQKARYTVLDDHLLYDTQEEMQQAVAHHLRMSPKKLAKAPSHLVDYDLELLMSEGCHWLVADVSEKSDGVAVELDYAWRRMKNTKNGSFPVLLLARLDAYRQRILSPFIGRFQEQSCPAACIRPYDSTETAFDHIGNFVDSHFGPQLYRQAF